MSKTTNLLIMLNFNSSKCTLLLGLVLASFTAFGQKSKEKKKDTKPSVHQRWEVNGFIGGSQYQGDVNDIGLKELNLGLGGIVHFHATDNLAIRANFLFGKLSGFDANSETNKTRGFSYTSPIRELSAGLEYDFLGKKRFKNADKGKFKKTLSPFVFAGAGFGNVNPDTDFNEAKSGANPQDLQKDKNYQFKKGFLTVPLGLGLKYDLSKNWTMRAEAGLRLTFNDYIDRISLTGNPDKNDTYVFSGITVGYRIPFIKDKDKDGVADDMDQCPEVAGTIKAKGCPDKDNDGVADRNDECPDEAGLRAMAGCPDTDRDGVADKEDECPDIIGLKELKGCPDTDEDGISDKDDECPNQKGVADYNGCPVKDSDNDGIEDKLDKCPTQKGTKEDMGCPPADSDNDGFPDKSDECPTEAGKVKGCPDKDSDNIADKNDKCPDVAGTEKNQGCPEIKAEDKKVLETAIYGVQFESGRSTFRGEGSVETLNKVVDIMNKYPAYNMRITGHTDSHGNDNKNLVLSESRAKACYQYFVDKGISKDRMTFVGLGELRPVADNATVEGRAQNRRVEFELFVK